VAFLGGTIKPEVGVDGVFFIFFHKRVKFNGYDGDIMLGI
jgi:hypothetical protein